MPANSPVDDLNRPAVERLTVDAKALGTMLGISRRTVCTLKAAGKLPASIRIGGRVVWRVEEVRRWLEAGAPPLAEWRRMDMTQM